MILLDSVGTFLDTDNGNTYPAQVTDSGTTRCYTPDLDNPYPVSDIEEVEWFDNLNQTDFVVVTDYLSNN